MTFAAPPSGGVTKIMKQQQKEHRMAYQSNTVQTCEGIACGRCKINIDHCACLPRRLAYRSVNERISGQGMVPATETQERRAA